MKPTLRTHALAVAAVLAIPLALACSPADGSATGTRAAASPSTATPAALPPASGVAVAPGGMAATAPAVAIDVDFTGDLEETETFIRYYQTIELTPEQERTKVEALSAIPAPCCADNPLATCCCPCNMAKAAWGLSAWLITEKGYTVDQVRQAAQGWLAAANPGGFTGNACYSGGCGRPIHDNGCGGMDDRHVL